MLLQLLVNGLANASITALVGTGFALIYNTTRVFHVAHGAVFTSGAYVYYLAVELLHWPWPIAFLIGILAAGLLGCAIETFVYAPLHRQRASTSIYLLTSLGLYIVLVNAIAATFGNQVQIARPISEHAIVLGPVLVTSPQVLELSFATLILLPLIAMLRLTGWGRLLYAARDNAHLLTAIGVDLLWIRRLVFCLGSMLAGAAGALSIVNVGVDPQAGMAVLLVAAVAVIVGGVGSFVGPIVGSVLLTTLQSLAVWQISPKWADAITFSVLILFMLFRPNGLMSPKTRIEESPA